MWTVQEAAESMVAELNSSFLLNITTEFDATTPQLHPNGGTSLFFSEIAPHWGTPCFSKQFWVGNEKHKRTVALGFTPGIVARWRHRSSPGI